MARYREEAEREERERIRLHNTNQANTHSDPQNTSSRESQEKSIVETLLKACPICKGDVIGDEIYLYFCKKCNLLYKKSELVLSQEQIDAAIRQNIAKRYSGELSIEDKKLPLKKIQKHQRNIRNEHAYEDIDIPEVPSPKGYVASKTSDKVHILSCPFAKNIKKSNRLIFKTLNDAKDYKRCKCID